MSRVLVTGSEGFLGQHIANWHEKQGDEVFRYDIKLSDLYTVENHNYILDTIEDHKTDTIVHCAANNVTANFSVNPVGTFLDLQRHAYNIILAAKSMSTVKRLIMFSSSEVYGDTESGLNAEQDMLVLGAPTERRSSYRLGKIVTEALTHWMLNEGELELKIIRPHNIYGPGQPPGHVIPDLFERAIRDGRLTVENRAACRAYCFIDDFVAQYAAIWRAPGNLTLNVGDPTGIYSVGDIAKLITGITGAHLVMGERKFGAGPRWRCPSLKHLYEVTEFSRNHPFTNIRTGLEHTHDWHKQCLRQLQDD